MIKKKDKIKDAGYEKHYVYNTHYHLIWCTKYRNQIFTNTNLAEKMRKILLQIAEDNQIKIEKMEIMPEHVHLLVSFKPSKSGSSVLNDILQKLHIINKSIPFLAQTNTAFPAVVVTIIWQGIPFFALMILAGLQGIPGELYEAADMDGATGFQKLFKITIPSIKNTIFITGLLRIIWVANSVDVIFNMTEGGPAYATQTLSVYVFNKAQALNLGYSSAMAILLALVLCLVAVPYLIFTFREEDK